MPTYFGYNVVGAFSYSVAGYSFRNAAYVTGFTCPGSGLQITKELSVYCKSAGGTPGNIRVSVYDAGHNLICQGVAEVAINSTTAGWYGHLTQAGITPNPCNLNGGQQYDIAWSVDSTDVIYYYDDPVLANALTYIVVDYTGGFPATLADAGLDDPMDSMRCGVDPVVLSIPVAMADYRQMRN